jgi:hypothetical protein
MDNERTGGNKNLNQMANKTTTYGQQVTWAERKWLILKKTVLE